MWNFSSVSQQRLCGWQLPVQITRPPSFINDKMSDKQLLDKDNSKPYKKHEIIIAVFAVLILVGFYFSQDEPQALQVQLKQPPYDLTSQQFNFIYFMTNIPNVVLGVVGGIIIDKIGIQKAGIIFSLGILLAQSVVTFSIYWRTAEFYE